MHKLLIKYRFQGYPYIVTDGKAEFYQLGFFINNYTRFFRKFNRMLNNDVTEGYIINRKFTSLKQLRKIVYVSNGIIDLDVDLDKVLFLEE